MPNPTPPRLDTFTLSGAALLDTGKPQLIKFISAPKTAIRDPGEPMVLTPLKPVVVRTFPTS